MATMGSLIGLVNRIQRACTVLGDHGGGGEGGSLWEALPSVAVVGGQVRVLATTLRTYLSDPKPWRPDLDMVLTPLRFAFVMHPEFREVVGAREHSGEGLPASWIR